MWIRKGSLGDYDLNKNESLQFYWKNDGHTHILHSPNLQHRKIQAIHLRYWETAKLKMLQSNWLRAFWTITWKPELSQISSTVKNMNFHYKGDPEKVMIKFSNPHFSKNYTPLLENLSLSILSILGRHYCVKFQKNWR